MLLAAVALHWFGRDPPETDTTRRRLKPWTITRTYDRLSHGTDCVISGRGLAIYDGAVVIDFGARADTSDARFTVPGARPQRALDNWPGNLPQHLIDRTPLGNPSDGLVVIPIAAIAGAHRLEVLRKVGWPRRQFDLRGLEAARRAAEGLGCPD